MLTILRCRIILFTWKIKLIDQYLTIFSYKYDTVLNFIKDTDNKSIIDRPWN
jgi:hypothetical protein